MLICNMLQFWSCRKIFHHVALWELLRCVTYQFVIYSFATIWILSVMRLYRIYYSGGRFVSFPCHFFFSTEEKIIPYFCPLAGRFIYELYTYYSDLRVNYFLITLLPIRSAPKPTCLWINNSICTLQKDKQILFWMIIFNGLMQYMNKNSCDSFYVCFSFH